MEITPDTKNLLDLVNKASTGEIVLPQFQRNFVWSRDDIRDLLISVLKGYFIGSFLLLDTEKDQSPFAMRSIVGTNLHDDSLRPETMILDGQQRLTSIHYVLTAPDIPVKWTKYPYRFFLNLNLLAEGEFDEAVTSERADLCKQYLDKEYQFQNLIIPFTVIPRWDEWQGDYELWLVDQDRELLVKHVKEIKPVWTAAINQIRNFRVPAIEIPKVPLNDEDRLAEVCAIFEKMNSTGVRLSVYDLLTARLYRFGIDLHSLWEEAIENHDTLREFSEGEPDSYGVYMLRTIALLRKVEVKSKTLVNLSPEGFEDDWRLAVDYFERALKRITSTKEDGFGAFSSRWLPYSTMTPVVAALLCRIDKDRHGHQAYKHLRKWYWGSAILQRYAGAVESITYRDYTDLTDMFSGKKDHLALFSEIDERILNNPKFSIRDTSRVNATYRAVINLIAIQGAKDFQADDSIEFHTLDDHHIFPKKHLSDQKKEDGKPLYKPDDINTVLNKTLIASSTNRRISRRSPSDYLAKLVPKDRMEAIMNTHFIGEKALAAMKDDDYPTFLGARERVILDRLCDYLRA
ncbi:DUF262 domain-containing protein [Acidobacteriota bacterium]